MLNDPLREALELAVQGRFGAPPNPLVGAVIVDADGEIVGRGFHRAVGEGHAETNALAEAGEKARGATLYVTLEPCSHHGRTPPCADALLEAGISRVVACHGDPNPAVSGRGFGRLRRGGVEVEVGLHRREALALNLGFLTRHLRRRPAITLKWAMSTDGRIATASGESQWISSPEGRDWALGLRELHDAILVGSGTALADDPSLNRRQDKAPGRITRVVLDRRLRLEPSARLFSIPGPVVVYTENHDRERVDALRTASEDAEVVVLEEASLEAVTGDLGRRGIQNLLVEGGGAVLGSFVAASLFDRLQVCYAPLLIGGDAAPGPLRGDGIAVLASAPRVQNRTTEARGPDLIVRGLREGCLAELEALLADVEPAPGG